MEMTYLPSVVIFTMEENFRTTVLVNTTVGQWLSCFQNGGIMAPRSVRRLLKRLPSQISKSPGYHIHVG